MIKVSVPKDFTQVQGKVFLNLTKRQVICFLPALAIGIPLFFLTRESLGMSGALLLMMISMMPFVLMAFYKHNDEYFEKYLGHLIRTVFMRKKNRPYRAVNLYEILGMQEKLDREVVKACGKRKG